VRAFPRCCEPVGDGASRVTISAFMVIAKDLSRWLVVTAGVVFLAPLWLLALCERRAGREGWFAGCSELLSLFPGKLGVFLRRSFYRMTLDHCAIDAHIGFGTTLAHPQVWIGRGVYVGNRCSLGMCVLEDHVTIGSNVDLLSGRRQHGFADAVAPIQGQGGSFTVVHLGRNTWVGNSAVIMSDVGDAAIIGAGAVVVHSIPAGAIAVGNPAVVKRTRAAA
jgi:virginiamycin A acetyltransferase